MFQMSTCWYTPDACTPTTCNGHGKCYDYVEDVKCDCYWGYEGEHCEVNKDRVTNTTDSFFTRFGNYIFDSPTINSLVSCSSTVLLIGVKSVGKIYLSNGEDVWDNLIYVILPRLSSGSTRNSSNGSIIFIDSRHILRTLFQRSVYVQNLTSHVSDVLYRYTFLFHWR